jgi:ribonuclease III
VRSDISRFEQEQQLFFHDKLLLRNAFVHSSHLNEVTDDDELADNERLEFLGDVIISFVVSEMLFRKFPELREGQLTRVRAALVRKETLARFARKLHLGDYLFLGRGEEESGGRKRPATLCATFEAVVGAIYLDQGLDAVREFVLPLMEADLEVMRQNALGKDPKSRLQEWAQDQFGVAPRYKVLDASGPDHAKVFTMQVLIAQNRYGIGRGGSKQDASQAAAVMALHHLGLYAPEYVADPELVAVWSVDTPGADEA